MTREEILKQIEDIDKGIFARQIKNHMTNDDFRRVDELRTLKKELEKELENDKE